VEQGQWTGVLEKELDNFMKIINKVNDTEQRTKLKRLNHQLWLQWKLNSLTKTI
jgi:hypothetical protein